MTTDTLPTLRAELRRLAEAATAGKWTTARRDGDEDYPGSVGADRQGIRIAVAMQPRYARGWLDTDGAFIAVANPSTILALLDHIDALEMDAQRFQWLANVPATDFPPGFWRDWLWERPGDSVATFIYAIDAVRDALAEQGEPK